MNDEFAVIVTEHAYLYSLTEDKTGANIRSIVDEVFSGWTVRILEEKNRNDYVKVETHYGYTGYMKHSVLCRISEEELKRRQNMECFFRIRIREVDLLDVPKVQGLPLELLLKNGIVELLEKDAKEGWSRVRTASGKEGFLYTQHLKKRRDDDGYLLAEPKKQKDYFLNRKMGGGEQGSEDRMRENLAASAMEYLGTQYRWGGKSSQGIDCSGLVFMSYLDQGILIYRDADIQEGYPIRRIPREKLKKGDLLFFPGHVAMHLGKGKYIHATGHSKTPYVTINSLNKQDADYRTDLSEHLTGCGSIFLY